MTKGKRALAMVGAGFIAVVAPVLAAQAPAGAAQTTANSNAGLTFVDSQGLTATCNDYLQTTHNTDNPKAPYLYYAFLTQQSGGDGGGVDCVYETDVYTTITYTDTKGQTLTSSFDSAGHQQATISDAASAVRVSTAIHFYNCDSSRSASCDLTITAAPK